MESNVSYKTLHEQFVSNIEGSTITEISVVLSSVASFVLLRNVILQAFKFSNILWLRILADFVFLILPLLLELTLLSESIDGVIIFITFAIITLFTTKLLSQGRSSRSFSWSEFLDQPVNSRLPFVAYSRAYTLVVTAISILAVDFTIYPRRFGKVETYGTGLMDCGVGIMIVSNAVVSPEARGKKDSSLLRSMKSCMPLLILGVLRVLSVKGTDYQEHVTEYGVHWNFFFTLAAVRVLSTILYKFIPESLWTVSSVGLISVYQYFLSSKGLSDYIINGSDGRGGRNGILDSNREGLFSSVGYLSIYLFSVKFGNFIFRKRRHNVYDWMKALVSFTALSGFCFILLNLSIIYIQPISRRFANLTFVIWMVGLGTLLLSVMLLSQLLDEFYRYISTISENKKLKREKGDRTDTKPICLLESVNCNGLFYFLLANLLTGLVNLSMKTIFVPPFRSFIIITVYMFSLTVIPILLYSKNIKLKFW